MTDTLLSVRDFSVVYDVDPPVEAVKNVTLELQRGEILGLAGESGCGKTTLAYGVQRLLRAPAVIAGGSVTFHDASGVDVDINALDVDAMQKFRWDKVSMVFQGAMNALNPVATIGSQLEDVFEIHRPDMTRRQRRAEAEELLEIVKVGRQRTRSFPHELSGGMRQRVMIAMALALRPQLMVMDEPTTALDVLVQREILKQISQLRHEFGFSVIFITHDLPLLLEISDRIAIMRQGEIVELAIAADGGLRRVFGGARGIGEDGRRQRRREEARRDSVAGDAMARPLLGDGAGELHHDAGEDGPPPVVVLSPEAVARAGEIDAGSTREVAAALSADLAMHRMHDEQLANARTRLVPLAKQRAQLDLESFGARRLDLGTALLSTLALAEAEVDALAREAEVARDAVRIIFTYGEARQ